MSRRGLFEIPLQFGAINAENQLIETENCYKGLPSNEYIKLSKAGKVRRKYRVILASLS